MHIAMRIVYVYTCMLNYAAHTTARVTLTSMQLQVGRPVEFGKLLTHIMAITPCEGEPALEPVRQLLIQQLHTFLVKSLLLHEQYCALLSTCITVVLLTATVAVNIAIFCAGSST
jgi:hypothetical protein